MRIPFLCFVAILAGPVLAKDVERSRQSVGNFELVVSESDGYIKGRIFRKEISSAIFSLKKSIHKTRALDHCYT